MSKLTFIIEASENVLNEKTAAIFLEIAKKNFITSAQIREKLETEEFSAGSINSNIGILIKKQLIEKSDDGFILSSEGTILINKAADIRAAAEAPELLKEGPSRKRAISDDMLTEQEWLRETVDGHYGLKDEPREYRSNILVEPGNRKLGVQIFEIRNGLKGFRLVYSKKLDESIIAKLVEYGFVDLKRKNGFGGYLDVAYSRDAIEYVIKLINEKIEETA